MDTLLSMTSIGTDDNNVSEYVVSLCIYMLSGAKYQVLFNPATATVYDIKKLVAAAMDAPINELRLFLQCTELVDANKRLINVYPSVCQLGAALHVIRVNELLFWYGTQQSALTSIKAAGHLVPSKIGFFGPGVYLTTNRRKAEAWARCGRKNQAEEVVLVKVRAHLGRCKTFNMSAIDSSNYVYADYDDWSMLEQTGFHSVEDLRLPEDDDKLCEAWYRSDTDALAWHNEGYDSQCIPESGAADVFQSIWQSVHFEICNEFWSKLCTGDEYVVADGTQVHYVSHETLPL